MSSVPASASLPSLAYSQRKICSTISFPFLPPPLLSLGLQLEGEVATVGITAHAADALGDIVYVDLPSVGSEFSVGDSFGAVESVKAASDVYSPLEGEVVEVNSELDDTPGKVNDSPMGEGWFMRLKLTPDGMTGFNNMLDEAAYKEVCENE